MLCRARNFNDKNRIEITLRCQVNHCDGSRASIRCALRLAYGTECSTSGANKAYELVSRKVGPMELRVLQKDVQDNYAGIAKHVVVQLRKGV